jgi:hypothetical protein
MAHIVCSHWLCVKLICEEKEGESHMVDGGMVIRIDDFENMGSPIWIKAVAFRFEIDMLPLAASP